MTKPTHTLINDTKFRDLVLALLNDEHGISKHAYIILLNMISDELYDEITLKVKSKEDRIYLPQGVLK